MIKTTKPKPDRLAADLAHLRACADALPMGDMLPIARQYARMARALEEIEDNEYVAWIAQDVAERALRRFR